MRIVEAQVIQSIKYFSMRAYGTHTYLEDPYSNRQECVKTELTSKLSAYG